MPQSNFPSAVFLQFAKWPEAGRVKTRLMPELGAVGALDAHIRLTLAVLDNLCATGYPVEFWWDRPADDRPGEAESIVEELEGAENIDEILLRFLTVKVKKFDLNTNYFSEKENNHELKNKKQW